MPGIAAKWFMHLQDWGGLVLPGTATLLDVQIGGTRLRDVQIGTAAVSDVQRGGTRLRDV